MGTRGPSPKRESGRRRANKTDPVTKATSTGKQYGPPLTGQHKAGTKRFYESLRVSGQAQFFQPSDWSYAAEVVCTAMDAFIQRPSAMMLASLNSCMSALLVTEADRRRVRLELTNESGEDEEPTGGVSELDAYRKRRSG